MGRSSTLTRDGGKDHPVKIAEIIITPDHLTTGFLEDA